MVAEQVKQAAEGPKSIGSLKRKADDLLTPKYRRGFAWSDSSNNISPSALYTETAPPLPRPPSHLVNDPKIQAALDTYKNHIQVDTPFDIGKLESMLHDHPNQPFVQSVLLGLREGFWPLDDGDWKIESEEIIGNYATEEPDLLAIRAFCDTEVKAQRWSTPIDELLPGMKISPMFVVWRNGKPRVVTDHTGSGLNTGIPREEGKVRYDDMHDFGQAMRDARRNHPGRRLVVFKDDVASAFLNLPAHPIWQLRQVVSVDGVLRIVRRLVFGNRASPRIWCSVSGLLCWIAIHKLSIPDLFVYMDNYFGWDFEENLVLFHGKLRPKRQVRMLLFWEAIGCPFDDNKQEHGAELKVIGFWVNINCGTISLSPSTVVDILDKISAFLSGPRNPALRDWQRLAGHLNWLLNVLPWGRPALTELYRKMSGKTQAFRGIFINAEVKADLSWLASIIPRSIGVRFVDAGVWPDNTADLVLWTDANLRDGLAFVYLDNGFVHKIRECPPGTKIDIFFLELVGILSAIHHVASFKSPPKTVLLYTDSLDSVGSLNSLRASESLHNGPLLGIASVILRSGIDLRVRHIEGKKNIRADLLSRLLFEEYALKFPSDRVRSFSPPRDLLPPRWSQSF